jgi:hypothetical protein
MIRVSQSNRSWLPLLSFLAPRTWQAPIKQAIEVCDGRRLDIDIVWIQQEDVERANATAGNRLRKNDVPVGRVT